MEYAQFNAQQVLKILRRRRRLIMIPVAAITLLCTLGAFLLPRKYESSTTILVQRDEVLNPLVSYEMAVTMASEDVLKTFNEIVYSTNTIQTLVDSLHLAAYEPMTGEEHQKLFKEIRKNISTERPGSSSFTIAYLDVDPVRAQKAVTILADVFIRTIIQVENQRNEMAVEFFENKLEELRQRFETSQQEMLAQLHQNIQESPGTEHMINTQLETAEQDLRDIGTQTKTYQQALAIVRTYPDPMQTDKGRNAAYEIARMNVPYAPQLLSLLNKYDDYSNRYTQRYPEVQKLIHQISDVFTVMRSTLEKSLDQQRNKRLEAEQDRAQVIAELQQSTVSNQANENKESNFDIYKKLYDEMKIKLEQARTTRDLGREQKNQFLVIDPPLVPTDPSKPNRLLITLGGFSISLIIGLLTAATAELLDTTMRNKEDFE
ncbi:MAG: hypothetical protein KGJ59_03510, partial [Bacteroidota bacterium]|nr:hypothetical protein [Bacteroidota bacterium]